MPGRFEVHPETILEVLSVTIPEVPSETIPEVVGEAEGAFTDRS